MYVNTSCIELLSKKPLWYIDREGNVGYIQNTWSDAETIRIHAENHISEYEITKNITLIPELNTVLFETEEDAIIGKSMMMDADNSDLMLSNGAERNFHECDNHHTKSSFPNGLYSLKEYDDMISSSLKIMEIRYLNGDEKIKLIHQSDEIPGLTDILQEYIKLQGIKINHHNPVGERLVFDVYSENGQSWIRHFWCYNNGTDFSSMPFTFSPLSSYPLFTSKEGAAFYRNDLRDGVITPFISTIAIGQQNMANGEMRRITKEERKATVKEFFSGAYEVASQFVSIDNIFNFVVNKTIPACQKAFHIATKKYRNKQRKAKWLKQQRQQKVEIKCPS